MTHDADRSDEERPSDADSGVRLSKNTGPSRDELETIADPNSPDRGESGRLPNWEDRERDARPGWEKAKIPKEEWVRAKVSNDAALARETPGSREFSRLMEARIHLHLGPPPEVDFGEISAYKRLKYQGALADDLRREIAEKEAPEQTSGLTARRMMVAAGILVLVVVVLFLIVLQGPSSPETEEPAATPTQTDPVTLPPKGLDLPTTLPPTSTTGTPVADTTAPAATPLTTAAAPTAVRTAKPTSTTKAVVTAPTGEVPFFKPKQK